MVQVITKDNFDSLVLNSDRPVLLDFWAEWCGPCRMLTPVVHELAEENPQILVGKVNVDEEMDLARQFGISSIPTVIAFRNGAVVAQSVGAQPKEKLLAMVE